MPTADAVPAQIDYRAFLSTEAKNRKRSQLKELGKYRNIPNIISFGGGLPSPETWPVNGLVVSLPREGKSVFVPGFKNEDPASIPPLVPYTTPTKASLAVDPLNPNLTWDLQYSGNFGQDYFVKWLTQHVKRIHNPPYPEEQWQVLNTAGGTDGWDGVVRTLLDKGDTVLLEEFAFPGSLVHCQSLGINVVGIPMDQDGIVPEALDKVLAEWDDSKGPRPRLVMVVPTCSNPTGVTYPVLRKKEIYAVARKWNLLIIEDDPYCYLQIRPEGANTPLVPSFLSLDIDARVVRIDTFSKFLGPGSRVGWITGPKPIVTAIMNKSESSLNAPSGFAVAAVSAVIQGWGGHEGLEQSYLPHISASYGKRCLDMLSLIKKHVDPSIIDFPKASGGMFLWVRIHVETHPQLATLSPEEISEKVFQTLVDEGVIVAPSVYFKTPGGPEWSKEEEAKRIFLRLSFSLQTFDEMEEGIKRLGRGLRREWGLPVEA
ncbi:hypothetical protein IAT38_000422 [Cryptococcus sp. DSM 104549]